MRILQTCAFYHPHATGAGKHVEYLAHGLAGKGHSVGVLTYRRDGQSLPLENDNGVEIRRISQDRRGLHYLPAVMGQQFDLIHAHAVWAHVFFSYLAALKNPGSRFVVTPHGTWQFLKRTPGQDFYYRSVWPRILRRADAILVLNEAEREEVLSHGIAETKIHATANGVDTELFHPETPPVGEEIFDLLVVGGIQEAKGVFLMLDIVEQLRKNWPQIRCRLVGIGPDEDRLREGIAGRGLSTHFDLSGRRDHAQLPAFYSAAKIVVVPSYHESFSITSLEGMAMQKPVVSTDTEGPKRIFASGKGGVLVPKGDSGAIAMQIERLLSDDALRLTIGKEGRAFVKEQYSWDQLVSQVEQVYLSLRR